MNAPKPTERDHLRVSDLPAVDESPDQLQRSIAALAPAGAIMDTRQNYLPAIFGDERASRWNLAEPQRSDNLNDLSRQIAITAHLMMVMRVEREVLRDMAPGGHRTSLVDQGLMREENNMHKIASWIRAATFDGPLTGDNET